MEQTFTKVGNSRMLRIPAKSIKEKKLTDDTVFIFKEDEDGYHFVIKKDKSIPKLTRPLVLSKSIEELLENPVTFTKKEKENPIIKKLLDEDFR